VLDQSKETLNMSENSTSKIFSTSVLSDDSDQGVRSTTLIILNWNTQYPVAAAGLLTHCS
jgi:hypothetical protein